MKKGAGAYLEPALARDLRARESEGKLSLAEDCLEKLGLEFNQQIADILVGELAGATVKLPAELPESANTVYVRAHLAANEGNAAAAAAHWERFFELRPQRDPMLLLGYARALEETGRTEDAARQLRQALAQHPRHVFFARAERLIRGIAAKTETYLRSCRAAVLGTSTTALLVPVLQACCFRDSIRAEIYEGLYGSQRQEILDPASGLARFRPDIVFLIGHWRDLRLPATMSAETEFIQRFVEEQKSLWKRLADQFGCHVVQLGLDFPAEEPYGYLAGSLAGGRTRVLRLINQRLQEEASSHVSILDTAALQREVGMAHWEDAMLWHSYRQHPASEALPALADVMTAHLRAVLGLTRKVLIADLDNTLWNGIIGEDGLQGIQIGPGSPAGEAHSELQRYMLDLKTRGVLLAVCSKNNPEDARQPFESHPHMLLKLEDFAAFQVNWDDKVQNIREVARRLSLGTDSFVFLDDNPLEREWVRSQLPEVAVVELGPSVFHYVRDLDRGRYFFSLALSAEDQARATQYRDEAAREQRLASAASLDDFLAELQMRGSVAPISAGNLARVTQLVNKTNQFNLTTRRYTEAQVRQIADHPHGWARAFHLSDRMGDYGLIGVIFCSPGGAREWEIDTWLMSCRALGRQMEKFMFDRLVEAALARGIRHLVGIYRPTAKNSLVAKLYQQVGFEQISASAEETRYRFVVPAERAPLATHIRDTSPHQHTQAGPA